MQPFEDVLSVEKNKAMKALFLLLILCYPIISWGQDLHQTVKGKVVDAETDQPIPGVTIIWVGSDPLKGVTSDENGYYRLEGIPVGRHSFEASFMGYENATVSNIMVSSGKETEVNFRLMEAIHEMQEVVVTGENQGATQNQMAMVSARSFTVEETKRYAGSFDDPGRMAQSFAGVSSNNDSSNEIVIRGNSPRGVLWKMEGIEIPNPNHFANTGASGGAISMLSSNMMANSDFFTGAFPGEYGNALSGVFDIHLRKGNFDKREYAFQLGVLGTDVALEGPFKKGYTGSYLVNYRYSTLSMLNAIGINLAGDAVPVFQDLTFNFSLPTKKAGNFTVFGLWGNSAVTENWEWDNLKYRNKFGLNTGIAGITHTYFLNDHAYLKTVACYSTVRNKYQENTYDTLDHFLYEGYHEDFVNTAYRASITFNNKLSSKSTLRAGVIATLQDYDLSGKYYDQELLTNVTYLDQSGKSGYVQSFFSMKHRLNEDLTLQYGGHYLYFALNGSQAIEPRASLRWNINNRNNITFGTGIHSRLEDLTVYMVESSYGGQKTIPNKELGPSKSFHAVLGYEFMVTENFRIRPELYYQYLFQIPIIDKADSYFSAVNFSGGYTTDSLVNKGTGQNIGLDFTAERFLNQGWFAMLTGSVFHSTYQAGNGQTYSTRFNGNYAATAVGGKEFVVGKKKEKKTTILSVSSRINYAGGRRYIPILLQESINAGEEVLDETQIFTLRQPDYFRIDLQLSLKINKRRTTQTIKIDAQNITNRQNIFGYYFDPKSSQIRTATQLGFVPVISYKIEF
jgi:hypothetical protein